MTAFRCPKKEAEISYQRATRFKKTPEWVVGFILLLRYHHIHISFIQYKFPILDRDYYISNRLEVLKTMLPPLAKNRRYTNWFGSFHFHNYLKWDDFCHYEWKFKILKVEWNVLSAEIRVHFIFNRKEIVHVSTHYYQSTPPLPVRILYTRPLTLYMMYFFLYPRNLDIIKYNKLWGHTFMTNFMILSPFHP